MNPTKCIPLMAAALAGSLLAGTPVAKLIATDGVTVRGVALPSTTQLTYPVSVNDEITTTSAKPATLEFSDGSTVTVEAGSTVRLEQSKKSPAIRVIKGNVEYRLAPTSNIEILNASGKKIGGSMNARMVQALAVTAQPASVRRTSAVSANAGASNSSADSLLAHTYLAGRANAAGTTTKIILPNGMTLVVTPNSTKPDIYTIQQIIVPVVAPAGASRSTDFVSVTSGSLIGGTLTPPGPGSTFSITVPGQTTPLPPDQAAQQINSSAQQTVNTAIQNGKLPPGTTLVPPAHPASVPNPPAPQLPPPVYTSPQ